MQVANTSGFENAICDQPGSVWGHSAYRSERIADALPSRPLVGTPGGGNRVPLFGTSC